MPDSGESKKMSNSKMDEKVVNDNKPNQDQASAEKNQMEQKEPQDSGSKNYLQESVRQEDHGEAEKKDKPKPKNKETHKLVFSDESIERYKQFATVLPEPEKVPATIMFARGYLNPALEFLADMNVLPVRQENESRSPKLIKNRVSTNRHHAQEFNEN
ncbi:hypothetical protein KR074_011215 [Drosophila pseudoananassae]|nr:hypothetical protein KR074_011215 [Drosophila pseudoananassae]